MSHIAKNIRFGLAAGFQGILLFIGARALSAGVWGVYPPAGLIVAGVLLIAGVILHGL